MLLNDTTTIHDLSGRENLPQSNSGRDGGVLDTLSGEHVSAPRPISGKRIPLTKGQFAIVDDADFEELSRHRWCAHWNPHTNSFYAVRNIRLPDGKRATERMHRAVLSLEYGDRREVDHLNHDTLNNHRTNIRIATTAQNQHNRRQVKGYCWDKSTQKFLAQIRVNGISKHLGRFDAPAEARAAYLAAKRIYHPSAPIPEAMI